MVQSTPIPLTIIGGYLGAGKTTLLNNILASAQNIRFAVLVNDFGALNIDAKLIASQDADTITLTNGCVCCSMADNLADTLIELATSKTPPEHILIEASGVALPSKVARYGTGWAGIQHQRSIVLADASTIQKQSKDKYVGRLVRDQITQADVLILNKMDLLQKSQRTHVQDWLANHWPNLEIIETEQAKVPVDHLFSSRAAHSPESLVHTQHAQAPNFWTFAIDTDLPFNRAKFLTVLEDLKPYLERGKGFISFEGTTDRDLFQWAGEHFSLSTTNRGQDSAASKTELVFIGTEPTDIEMWKDRFLACRSH